MKLITDYATPYELSVAARVSSEDRERTDNKLSEILPTETVDDVNITLVSGADGRVEVAEYRAFDAETSFGHTDATGKRQVVSLAPLGQQARVSEHDRLVQRNSSTPERVKQILGRKAVDLGRAVADRLELARGQVLQDGALNISENGFQAEVDFQRDPAMTVNAATPWSDQSVDVIEEIQNWVEAYVDLNGEVPEHILSSRQVINAIKKSNIFGAVVNDPNSVVTRRVTTADVQQFLVDEGLPTLKEYNRKVRRNGASVDVLNPNILVFTPPATSGAGSTALGTTLESLSPRYGMVAGEEAGIVVGAYESDNPMGLYLNSAALGIPVLHDANKFMAATVL